MTTEWREIAGVVQPVEVYGPVLPECPRCGRTMNRGPLDAEEEAEREAVLVAMRGLCVCRLSPMDGMWFHAD